MSVLRSLAFGLSLALSSAALVGASSALASEGETAKIDYRAAEPDQEFFPCTGTSTVKVKVEADALGGLLVTGVVFSDGEDRWPWKFKHDDDFSFRGEVRAKEREVDRSFRVVRSMVNFDGTDVVTFRAENETTAELCVAELAY